ncbi:hypothetical protein BHE74_00022866, partial [Ensete ventricosum]
TRHLPSLTRLGKATGVTKKANRAVRRRRRRVHWRSRRRQFSTGGAPKTIKRSQGGGRTARQMAIIGSLFCCGRSADGCVLVWGIWRWLRRKKGSPTWRVFSLKELYSATNNFNYDNKLGEGGFGSVYWGRLRDGSQVLCRADFGFAKLIPDGATHVTTRVKGTLGYLAPEYAMLGKASESCDVYSFGILLLELATGKRPIEKLSLTVKRPVTDWALPLARERRFKELADPKLKGDFVESELRRMVLVGLICAQSKPEKRPTMLDVIYLLKEESKEKLLNLENNELFRTDLAACDQSLSGPQDSSDGIETDSENQRIKEAGPSTETISGNS